MIDMSKRSSGLRVPAGKEHGPLPQAIDLGAHHLLLNSDQSIELIRAEQGQAEPAYVLCLDTT